MNGVHIFPPGGGGTSLPVADTQTIVMGSADATKLLRFEVDGFTSGATRVVTFPDANITVARIDALQTFTGVQTFADNPIITNTAPSLALTDTTGSAKSLTIAVDSNLAQFRESAGAANSMLVLDLANTRLGFGGAPTLGTFHLNGAGSASTGFSMGGFTQAAAATATMLYGILIDKNGANSVMIGVNKNSVTGSVPADAGYISTYLSTKSMIFGRGGDNALPGTVDINMDGTGNLGFYQLTFGTNAVKVIAHASGTAPSSSPADCYQLYSADQAAGNACPHFRTENGGIVKLFTGTTFTQTYSTADATHANATAATLTDNTAGTANTTLEALSSGTVYATDVAAIRNNFADLAAQHNALLVDVIDVKQLCNSIIDLLQGNGLAA